MALVFVFGGVLVLMFRRLRRCELIIATRLRMIEQVDEGALGNAAGFEFLKKGKSMSATALAKSAGLKVRGGARVSLSVRKGTASCRVSGVRVSTRAKGYCRVAVTMRVGGRSATRVVDITVL